MPSKFISKKATHVILFVLHSMGKVADPSRLFLILYLADLKHLAKHGTLVLGDVYVAMKYGPAPFHLLSRYQQLRDGQDAIKNTDKYKDAILLNDKDQFVATEPYSNKYLSESEVICLFETMQLYKNASFELLSYLTMSAAWNNANANGEISILDMAKEGGATQEMMARIASTYLEEKAH